MDATKRPIRIKLYSVDYAHHRSEDLDLLTTEFYRKLNNEFEGDSRIMHDNNLPEGAKVAVVGVVGSLIIEQVVTRSVDHAVSILFDFVRNWLKEKRGYGDVRAKIQIGNQSMDLTQTMRQADIDAQVKRLEVYPKNSSSAGERFALVIGNTEYTDRNLTKLNAPQADAEQLANVLKDVRIGGFKDVQVLLNEPSSKVKQSIELLFRGKTKDDLLFLYFSGHGIKDENGNLYLATSDTRHDFARSTGISANFIKESMDNSFSRRKVLMLDCCYSGAFIQGAKSPSALGSRIYATDVFRGGGYGQVVVTASDTMQFAWEGNKIIGNTDNSFFTHYLIEGLRTGKADVDKDGRISVTDLYSYVYDKVIGKQTPSISSTEMEGKIILARNPHPVARPDLLPEGLEDALKSPHIWQREGAIIELGRLLNSNDSMKENTARFYLEKLAKDDSRKVSLTAQQVLSRYGRSDQPSNPSIPSDDQFRHVSTDENNLTTSKRRTSSPGNSNNTSGLGKFAEIPNEIKGKWNWGAFLLGWIWGIGNSTWISFALFIPYVGFVMPFILGLKGNEWAWRNKQWDSIDHFQRVQKEWRKWGVIIVVALFIFFSCIMFYPQ